MELSLKLGRAYLFTEICNNKKNVESAIDLYNKDRDKFNYLLDSAIRCSFTGDFNYDIATHTFRALSFPQNIGESPKFERDHLLYRIRNFCDNIFGNEFTYKDEKKSELLKSYLLNKLGINKNFSEREYILNGKKDEEEIIKLFNKIKEGKFKNFKDKDYKKSDSYKKNQLRKKINELELQLDKKNLEFTQKYLNDIGERNITVNQLIEKINERLNLPISDSGRNILNKILPVIEEFDLSLEGVVLVEKINFHPLIETKRGYKNCFSDEKIYNSIDSIFSHFEDINDLINEKKKNETELRSISAPEKEKDDLPEQNAVIKAEVPEIKDEIAESEDEIPEDQQTQNTNLISSILNYFRK